MANFSTDDLKRLQSNLKRLPEAGITKSHKYNAKATEVDFIKFPSIAEAEYYKHLKQLMAACLVRMFHRQVRFDLPGGTYCTVDFMVFCDDGTGHEEIQYIDVKGKVTASYKRNRKQVLDLYGIEIISKFYDYKNREFYEKSGL